ncbi:MAG: OmpA family protein [Bacteroidia bacterium]
MEKKEKSNKIIASVQIAILFSLFCSCSLFALNREVNFEQLPLKKALEKAQKNGKMLFVDCYTSWCGPCFWMKNNVFNNDSVADFYNSKFICIKVDMEKEEGALVAKKYKVTSYPSMLYLNEKGEVLHRTAGSVPPQKFIENGKDALDPQKQLVTHSKLFADNPADAKIAYSYFKMLENLNLLHDSLIIKYFSRVPHKEILSLYNWKILYAYSGYYTKEFKYLLANRPAFSKAFGADSVESKINNVFREVLFDDYRNNRINHRKKIIAEFRGLKTKDCQRIIAKSESKLVTLPNATIEHAMEIKDPVLGMLNVSTNQGAWFKFVPGHDTTLTFDLVPEDSLDDYDFSLYECNNEDCVDKLKLSKAGAVRSCYSYCTSKSGVTGLSEYTQTQSVGIGPGPAYAASIRIKAGRTYYLYVYAYYPSVTGFTIYLYNMWPKRKPVVMQNILFESNKSILLKESFPEVDKLVLRLQKSTQMKIEVRGHTDNMGDRTKNQMLSEERAKAVVDYMVSKGIAKDRLFYKGFGCEKPITNNATEAGRKKNRRVEFVMVMN